jgi:2-dehydro-3-deoxyphosphogalactonate aldolase
MNGVLQTGTIGGARAEPFEAASSAPAGAHQGATSIMAPSPYDLLKQGLLQCPLVAILRGIEPDEVEAVGRALVDQGMVLIEVPLNSPQPMRSIEGLSRAHPGLLIGAGTVTSAAQVQQVHAAGGRLVVSPHWDQAVLEAALALDMACIPGVATPTEAFAAHAAGAHALKLFPAEMIGPAVVKAIRAVLPPELPLMPVGGITTENMPPYWLAGARGFGIGSALYAPGRSADQVGQAASRFVAAWRQCAGA